MAIVMMTACGIPALFLYTPSSIILEYLTLRLHFVAITAEEEDGPKEESYFKGRARKWQRSGQRPSSVHCQSCHFDWPFSCT